MVELKTFFTYKVENDNFNTIIEFEKNRYSRIFLICCKVRKMKIFLYKCISCIMRCSLNKEIKNKMVDPMKLCKYTYMVLAEDCLYNFLTYSFQACLRQKSITLSKNVLIRFRLEGK